MTRPPPTLARLLELLNFEPGIGLRWKVSRGSVTAGRVAGGYHHSGRERIGVDGASYRLDAIIDLYHSSRATSGRARASVRGEHGV